MAQRVSSRYTNEEFLTIRTLASLATTSYCFQLAEYRKRAADGEDPTRAAALDARNALNGLALTLGIEMSVSDDKDTRLRFRVTESGRVYGFDPEKPCSFTLIYHPTVPRRFHLGQRLTEDRMYIPTGLPRAGS